MTRTDKYTAWIVTDIVKHNGLVRGRCQEASARMVEAFPELRHVRGYARLDNGFAPAHWWCEREDGAVVDPTATQFEGVIGYDEYNEDKHGPLPIGKCGDCGTEVYKAENHNGFCDEICEASFEAYMQKECSGWNQ